MNSSDRDFSEYQDNNQSNAESSNTQEDSNEQDDKNIESLFELSNFPSQSSDDDLMSLFANSEMPEENTPEIMLIGEETELFTSPEMLEETSEIDLFNTPEIMLIGEETELFTSPEMMSMGENIDLLATPEMMSMGEDTSEIDLFNTPEMMSMGEDTSEIDLFNTPEMMSMGENIDLLATPEMMSMGEDTSEIDLVAYHEDLVTETDNISQLTEVIATEREQDSSQQSEITEETNDMNLGLGIAAIPTGASIPLLEERLIVDVKKQKIGEVVVRKEIETEMIQVPIRREKLIVEQVGEEIIQLAKIDLGQSEIQGVDLATNTTQIGTVTTSNELIVAGEFTSAKIVSLLLNAIALERRQGCKKIKIQIVVDDTERQQTYQEWVDRCSIKPSQN